VGGGGGVSSFTIQQDKQEKNNVGRGTLRKGWTGLSSNLTKGHAMDHWIRNVKSIWGTPEMPIKVAGGFP